MIQTKKSLGQNWLINPHILDKIVLTAEVDKNDTVLEIGPGTGNLTKKLAEQAGKVIAIEKDRRLIPILKETFKNYPNIEIVKADILRWAPSQLRRCPSYKIVANIPYYITSNFLRTVFESWPQPKLIVLTIQKEVAQRIVAKPPPKNGKAVSGQAHMNLLALSVQYYSEPEIIGHISKNNFRPIPKVDSAVIRLKPHYHWHRDNHGAHGKQLFELIRAGFSEKRKQLAPVLSKKLKKSKEKIIEAFEKLNLSPIIRAENLSLEQWEKLSTYLSE